MRQRHEINLEEWTFEFTTTEMQLDEIQKCVEAIVRESACCRHETTPRSSSRRKPEVKDGK